MRFLIISAVALCVGIGSSRHSSGERDGGTPSAGVQRAGPQSTSRPTACSLIGQEEMSRILAGAVGPPAADEGGGSTTCTYTPASGKGVTPYVQVKIDWSGGEAAMAGMKLADSFMSKDAAFAVADKIEGVGDEASMMIGGVMNVRKGEMFMTIDLRMQSRAKEKGITIAKTILARTDKYAK
jgi:hypothetical protein